MGLKYEKFVDPGVTSDRIIGNLAALSANRKDPGLKRNKSFSEFANMQWPGM